MTAMTKALVGGAGWAVFVLARGSNLRDAAWTHALLLFAALVLVPLAFELFDEENDVSGAARLLGWARQLQLPAAGALLLACWLAPGPAAAVAALPWVALTGALAAAGFLRVKSRGLRRALDRLCADAALMFSAIGGAWTLADRAGYQPLQFDAAIVGLTAVHFHYAGLLLPLFAGLVQRELWFSRFASRAAVGVVLGVPAVALGITTTQLGWGVAIEAGTGSGLALAGMAVAILQVRIATEARRPMFTRAMLGVAGVALFFSMVLAALYAARAFAAPFPWLGIPQMRMLHGTANAFGFGLCGVIAWRQMKRASEPAAGGGASEPRSPAGHRD
jgi:hypothetical protein